MIRESCHDLDFTQFWPADVTNCFSIWLERAISNNYSVIVLSGWTILDTIGVTSMCVDSLKALVTDSKCPDTDNLHLIRYACVSLFNSISPKQDCSLWYLCLQIDQLPPLQDHWCRSYLSKPLNLHETSDKIFHWLYVFDFMDDVYLLQYWIVQYNGIWNVSPTHVVDNTR